ncbi:MAG: OmpA family protein, partial [Kineosporiaceae bacterium]
ALLLAVEQRNLLEHAGLFAAEVELAIPSLTFRCHGRDEVSAAVAALLTAFPDLEYTVRHRYIAPGSVTDEVLLTGTRTGDLLGVAGDSRTGRVLARLQYAHDGTAVTAISLWADRGTLQGLLDDPAPQGDAALTAVAALRATLPPGQRRVTVGQGRQPAPPPVPPAPPGPSAAPVEALLPSLPRRPPPTSRRMRRLRGTALGSAMLLTAAALLVWTARGTLSDTAVPAPAAAQTRAAPVGPVPGPLPSGVTFQPQTRTYDLSADVLFALDSDTLTPHAREILALVVAQIRELAPTGAVTVTGYTDSVGTAAYNARLSLRRARAVAVFLGEELADLPGLSVVARGAGEDDPVGDNATAAGRAANRRVSVVLPDAVTSPATTGDAPASAP